MAKNSIKTNRDRKRTPDIAVAPRTAAPSVAEPPTSWNNFVVVGALGLLAIIGAATYVASNSLVDPPPPEKKPAPRKAKAADWQPTTADDVLCDRFMKKRNSGDAAAANLLENQPPLPSAPVSEKEADRLQTVIFLHDPELKIRTIHRGDKTADGQEYVFVTKGNVSAPTITIGENNQQISTQQRVMSNPDLFATVRDGKIVGLRAAMHRE